MGAANLPGVSLRRGDKNTSIMFAGINLVREPDDRFSCFSRLRRRRYLFVFLSSEKGREFGSHRSAAVRVGTVPGSNVQEFKVLGGTSQFFISALERFYHLNLI